MASAELFEAPDDSDAINVAIRLNRAAKCELWQQLRFVAFLGANRRTGVKSFRFDYEL